MALKSGKLTHKTAKGGDQIDDYKFTDDKGKKSLALALMKALGPTTDDKGDFTDGKLITELNRYLPFPPDMVGPDKAASDLARKKFAKALAVAISQTVATEVLDHIKKNLGIKGIKIQHTTTAATGGGGSAAMGVEMELKQSNDGVLGAE